MQSEWITRDWFTCVQVRLRDDHAAYDLYSFFFQAEDGIRDLTVTGVQTCALPISGVRPRSEHAHGLARRGLRRVQRADPDGRWRHEQRDHRQHDPRGVAAARAFRL